jgi:4-hydroxybutyryl-CoA dehydratase/vinylacetyl-CoA-Delta-isomerase
MLSGGQFRDSLDDGRRVYFEGRLIENVAKEPIFAAGVDWVARGYDAFYSDDPDATHPLATGPRTVEDLHAAAALLSRVDVPTSTTHICLMTLLTAAPQVGGVFAERIYAYYEECRRRDVRIAECITDAKGDRTVAPGTQADPDSYVRVVETREDGVVIRGAKLHITGAPLCHELLVMPTKRMNLGEEQYAIACAMPIATEGVSLVATTYAPRAEDDRHFPLTSRENVPDAIIFFNDVFVPNERVFLLGQVEHSATFAHSLGLWERLGGTTHMADEGDLLVGLAQLIAEANGIAKVSHVREKIAEMIIYATLIRAGLEAAVLHSHTTGQGYRYPDELYTNVAKFHGAFNYNAMVRNIHDIAGGGVLTAPTIADFENTDMHDLIEKYMQGSTAVSGEVRMRLFHAIRDVTADMYGAWHLVTNVQSGGGLYAQRLVTRKHYNMARAKELAMHAAGLTPESFTRSISS